MIPYGNPSYASRLAWLAAALFLLPILNDVARAETLSEDKAVSLFTRANETYAKAKKLGKAREAHDLYERARTLYRRLVDGGFRDAQVFYNLGNTNYYLGRLGRAILWYRRAEQIIPRNADLKENLRQAKGKTRDPSSMPIPPPVIRGMFFWHFAFSLDEETWIALVLYGLLMVGVVVYIFTRSRWAARIAMIVGIMLLAVSGSLLLRVYRLHTARPGVVTAREAVVRYGPGEEYEAKFKVHEGAELAVEAERENWYKVLVYVEVKGVRPSNAEAPPAESENNEARSRWIPKDAVEKV